MVHFIFYDHLRKLNCVLFALTKMQIFKDDLDRLEFHRAVT